MTLWYSVTQKNIYHRVNQWIHRVTLWNLDMVLQNVKNMVKRVLVVTNR